MRGVYLGLLGGLRTLICPPPILDISKVVGAYSDMRAYLVFHGNDCPGLRMDSTNISFLF